MEEALRLRLSFNLANIVRFTVNRIRGPLPRRPMMRFARRDGHPTLVPGDAPMAKALVGPLNDLRIQDSEWYAALANLFIEHAELSNAILPTGNVASVKEVLLSYIIRFQISYFARTDGAVAFDDDVFSALLRELEQQIDAGADRWLRRSPLHNFSVPPEAPQIVALQDGIEIRPLRNEERDEWHNGPFPDQLHWPSLANVSHVLEIRYERPRFDVGNLAPTITEDEIVFLLRMSGTDAVSFGITEQRLLSVWTASLHYANFRLEPKLQEDRYSFDLQTQALFTEMYHSYLMLRDNRAFNFAVRRYNDGCSRLIDEDRVVDFWVSTEALFTHLRDPRDDGLRQRIAERMASFLEPDNFNARAERYAEIYESYKTRSQIVHGSLRRIIDVADVQLIHPHIKASLQRILRTRRLLDPRSLDN